MARSSSSKQLHVLLYGKLALPALSLALLTGFTFSITIPSAPNALFPALHSLFLVSLPHFWHASLSWFTPPCLFLLLNAIIVILTATSGSFSKSPPPSNLLVKIEKPASHSAVASAEPPSATSTPIPPFYVRAAPPPAVDSSTPEVPVTSFTDIAICYHSLHAQGAAMEEIPEDVVCHGEFNDITTTDDDHNMQEMQIIPHEVDITDRLRIDSGDDPCQLGIDGSDDPTGSSYEEVLSGCRSEPSTPKHSSNPTVLKDNMRRSLSIDSVPYIDNVEESPEYKLSEEAFKKRIEDYICKVNAKLRSETRFT